MQAKVKEIWKQLSQYINKPISEFSNRWLESFKKRFKISLHIRHREAGSTPAEAEDKIRSLQTLAGEYEEENIYNMDESGLFWQMIPSQGLSA